MKSSMLIELQQTVSKTMDKDLDLSSVLHYPYFNYNDFKEESNYNKNKIVKYIVGLSNIFGLKITINRYHKLLVSRLIKIQNDHMYIIVS